MSTTRTSEAEIASELAQRLTGVPGYSPGQERELVRAFHAAAAAVEVGDDVAAVVLGAWWWPYRLSVLARALNAQAAHVLGWRARPPRRWTSFSGAGGPGGLTRARTRALVDVNTAPAAELATLPGLGPVTARRIVGARPYRRVRDVRTAAGLSKAAWERARPTLIVDPEPVVEQWPGGSPGVAELFAAVRAGRFELPGERSANPPASSQRPRAAATAVETIAFVAGQVAARRTRRHLWSPSAERLQLGWRGFVARDLPEREVQGVAPVRGSAYVRLLLALLKQGRDVNIAMFFVSGSSALDELLDALGGCRTRGGRVRVLLADSLEGDVRGAADVNAPGLAALRRRGVQVRSWWPEVALHEKSVVIDGRHVLVGSHNWTASSFYRHDETSLYLDSAAVAADMDARFERRWKMLDPNRNRRVIALAELACLSRDEVERLAGENVHSERDLPEERAALRDLGRRAKVAVDDLAFARAVGVLMRDLRVCEVTAGCLAVAGFLTLEDVAAAPRELLLEAIERPQGLPDALDRRPVNPAVVDLLPETV